MHGRVFLWVVSCQRDSCELQQQLQGDGLHQNLDMHINALKSACIRFGPRYGVDCANITMKNGEAIAWVSTCRYLGLSVFCEWS